MNKESKGLIEHVLSYLSASEGNGSFYPVAEGFDGATAIAEIIGFMDEIPGGFLIYRAEGNEEILHANKALLEIFKCDTLQEFRKLTGNSFKGFVYHKDLEAAEKSIREQIFDEGHDIDYVEYRIMRKDGEIRWVEDFGHYLYSESVGHVFYVFVSDITDEIISRQEETKALMSEKDRKIQTLIEEYDKERKLINQEYLRRLEVIEGLSISYDTILYVDLDSDKVLPYRYNHRTGAHFRQSDIPRVYSEYIDNYMEWVIPDDVDLFRSSLSPKHIRETLVNSKTFMFTYRVNDRGIRHIQLRVVSVGAGKHISQIVIGSRDIEDDIARDRQHLQMLEEALRTANKANSAKDTFLSNMSHDMRTPLNAIFGYATLAQSTANKATLKYLEKIKNSANQLLSLVEQVLEYSQIESDVSELNEKDCNLVELTESVCDGVREAAKQRKIKLRMDCGEIGNREVRCDSDKLRQALEHIVSNAVKYALPEGTVCVKATQTATLPNGYASYEFSVKDDGPGISQDLLEKIFEPFERVNNTTKSGVYGAGLGLTISKRLIESMGGSICAESEEGTGSNFVIRLNMRFLADSEKNLDTVLAEWQGKKILLTDDNEINLELETEILENAGFAVEQATDGKIAYEKIAASKAGEYSLVLMDIQMPVMDGRQSAELIRKLPDPQLANIPIIALSANAFDSDRKMSMACGMDAHLAKPLDLELLLRVIASVLSSRGKK